MSSQGRPPAEPTCPRCGAPHEPGQEYCLECGYRLRPAPGVLGRLSGAWQARFGWYPGDWFWRILLGLVIAVAGSETKRPEDNVTKRPGGDGRSSCGSSSNGRE